MSKLTIIIADEDENYLSPIEIKFLEEIGDVAEIITITDRDYFDEYFSIPRKVDVLIIDKIFYKDYLSKHDINKIFILNETSDEIGENEIYKYTSVKDIYDEVIGNVNLSEEIVNEKKHTNVIMVYSPAGGTGVTTLSLVLAKAIANKHKKVLYLSTENMQSLAVYENIEESMSKLLEKAITTQSYDIHTVINNEVVVRKGISYIPPAKQATTVLGIKEENYLNLIAKMKEVNMYDYIVVDTDSELTQNKCAMMALSDKVVIVVAQNEGTVKKTDIFLENIDCSDLNKFLFVCNKYRTDKENNLTNSSMKNQCIVKQYIEYLDNVDTTKIAETDAIQNFAYNLI